MMPNHRRMTSLDPGFHTGRMLPTQATTTSSKPDVMHGDVQFEPTFTQSLVSGQQVVNPSLLPLQIVAFFAQEVLDGVRQCFASGQQYSLVLLQGDVQLSPALTQSAVTGQHMGKPVLPLQAVLLLGSHCSVEGVRHFFASGQQYSVV